MSFIMKPIRTRCLVSVFLAAVTGGYGIFNAIDAAELTGSGGYDAPFFQADFCQDLSTFSSALVNPALLYRVNQLHVDFSFYRWGLGALKGSNALGYQQGAVLYPIRRSHTAGLTFIGAGSPIEATQPHGQPVDDGPTQLQFADMWLIGNYGVRVLPWLMLGTNLKFRYQNQFGSNRGYGFGMDAGVYFNPIDHYRFGDVGVSVNLQDFVPSRTSWKHDNVPSAATLKQTMTTRFRGGVRYAVFNDALIMNVEVVVDNMLADLWKAVNWIAEEEYRDTTGEKAFPKIGRVGGHIRWEFIPQVWLKAGWTNNQIPYAGFNANLMFPLPEMINNIGVDFHLGYAFLEDVLSESPDERDFTMMSRVSADVGRTREQKESKRLYDKLILAPMNAYNEAMRLYVAGKYWEASFAFGKVMALFPNFHLNDKATWYMGDCYGKLGMNAIARQVFTEGLETYTTSEVRPRYLYGLEWVDYREGKYEEALKNHAFIVNLYPESDIRSDADYIAGEIHFQRKNYHAAEQLLSRVEPGAPAYLYAQYTLSIINIENKKVEAAIANLRGIIGDTTSNESAGLLMDAANTKLGHLYFEEVELRRAVESYSRVKPGSPYGDEAILGSAWSWIKVNQPSLSEKKCDQLMAEYPSSPLVPEAHLLKGYALMLQKRYSRARSEFELSIRLCNEDFITAADVSRRRGRHETAVESFSPTGEQIYKNAMRKPTARTVEERGELKTSYRKFDEENREFFEFLLLAKSHKKFLRRKEQLLMDAEYALAKVEALTGTQGESRAMEKTREEAQELDEEIRKLQQELQGIDE